MKRFLLSPGAVAGGLAAILGSCAYDPHYGTSVSGVGYWEGGGYGYGGGSVSTSVFVSTGNPRWVYDPGCFSYYDTTRRCYYDPVLCAYYPAGHRPALFGRSHPHGWRHGRTHCPPPARVRDVCVSRDQIGSGSHAHDHGRKDRSFVSETHHSEPRRPWSHGSNPAGARANHGPDAASVPSWIERRATERNPWHRIRSTPGSAPVENTDAPMPEPGRGVHNRWSSRMREADRQPTETRSSFPSPSSRLDRGESRAAMSGFERRPSAHGFGGRMRQPGGGPPASPAPSASAPAPESALPEA